MFFATLATLTAALASSPARAAPETGSGWAVIAATDSEDQVARAQELAKRLERALDAAGAEILPAEEALQRFEAVHSTEPVVLAPDALQALREQVQEATRYLALHRLKDALSATEKLRRLGNRAQDFLRRELGHAQELFDVCVVTATQIAEGGEQLEAYRHMLRCAQTFPGLEPQAEYHSPDVRELYDTVLENLDETQPAELVIRSTERGDCTTRVNGISWGPAPAEIKASPTQVRIQLECGAEPGRVHTTVLRPGFNEITIDPVFDAAIRSSAPRLTLVYDGPRQLTQRLARDSGTLAGAVNAEDVVTVELTGKPTTPPRSFTTASSPDAAGPGHPGGPIATIRLIDTRGHLVRQARWKGSFTDPAEADRIARALTTGEPAADTPSEVGSAKYHPALPLVDVKQSNAWVFPAGIALGYATSIGGSLYALADRSSRRKEALTGDFPVGYEGVGTTGLILTATGSALSTTLELIGLPDRDRVPWYAWVGGAAGLAAASTGIYALAAVDSCQIGDDRLACTAWTRDNLFAPLLLVQSAPLLTMPLTYAVSSALGPGASATVDIGQNHAQLKLRGTF